MAAARRAGRGAAGDPRLRGGAPRSQAGQRPAGHRRAPGDRLRHLAGGRRDLADRGRGGVRHARLHVPRAGRGPRRRARERRVRAGLRGRLRGGGNGTVRHRDGGRRLVPGGALRAAAERGPAEAPRGAGRVPGQGPGGPADPAGAVGPAGRPPGLHRAVRGGVLAVVGSRPDRRVPGPAGAGNTSRHPAGRRVLLGQPRAPAPGTVRSGAAGPVASGRMAPRGRRVPPPGTVTWSGAIPRAGACARAGAARPSRSQRRAGLTAGRARRRVRDIRSLRGIPRRRETARRWRRRRIPSPAGTRPAMAPTSQARRGRTGREWPARSSRCPPP